MHLSFRRPIVLIYLLFSFSGFAGLIYEAIWARYLKLLLGHSSYGQILTLMIFMGGLGIGSFLGGRYARVFKKPLYLYAACEVLIGLGGLIYHPFYEWGAQLFFNTASQISHLPWLLFAVKIMIALIITMPWAILLGMTFPALAIGLIDLTGDAGQRSLPWLYFTNSLGGAIGVLCSSFILIPKYGTVGTLAVAATCNIFLGLIFYLLAKGQTSPAQPLINQTSSQIQKPFQLNSKLPDAALGQTLLWISLLTGFSSFLYEIGWIRLLNLLMGSSTHAFDLMLSAFILGLASGSLLIRFAMRTTSAPLHSLAWVQLLMGLCAALSLVFYEQLFTVMNLSHDVLQASSSAYPIYSIFRYLLCLLLMFPASFFAGMTLPLISWMVLHLFRQERYLGHVYGYNTLGAILGSALGGLWLLPWLQLKWTLLSAALVDIVIGLMLFWVISLKWQKWLAAGLASTIALIPAFGLQLNSFTISSGLYRSAVDVDSQKEFHTEAPQIRHGRTATISFHHFDNLKIIKTNGKPDASVSDKPNLRESNDEITQTASALYPIHLMKHPYQAAMIGLGSGMTAHYLLNDPLLEHLDSIEIEPEMYHLARGFLPWNQNIYTSPKNRMIFDDARTFFYSQNKKYDVIISEPSNPWVSGVSSLFTEEFYQDIQRFLKPEGVLVQWIQSYEFDSRLLLSILRALHTEFPHISVYGLPGFQRDQVLPSNILILASKQPIVFPPKNALRPLPELTADLKRLDMTPQDFDRTYRIATERTLASLFMTYPANSDFFPVVDTQAEKYRYTNRKVDLYDFLLFTPVYYQSVFEPDFHALLIERLQKGKADLQHLLKDLEFRLSAPPDLIDPEQLNKDVTYLFKRFFPILNWQEPALQKYRRYLNQHAALGLQKLEFDFLAAVATQNGQGLRATVPTLLTVPPQHLQDYTIRALALTAISHKDQALYRQVVEKLALPHPKINSLEKEWLQRLLPQP